MKKFSKFVDFNVFSLLKVTKLTYDKIQSAALKKQQ